VPGSCERSVPFNGTIEIDGCDCAREGLIFVPNSTGIVDGEAEESVFGLKIALSSNRGTKASRTSVLFLLDILH
jgi:hypothetical protein